MLAALAGLLLVGADVVGRNMAQERIEERARARVPGAGSIDADIDSFPFLPRLFLSGSVSGVGIHLEQVPARSVHLTSVDVDLRGVKLERDSIVSGDPRLESVERGTLSMELDGTALSRALRVPVSVQGGEVRAGAGRAMVRARPEVGRDGALVLRLSGPVPLRVYVPRTSLVDCTATRVAVVGDRVRLSCDLDGVPTVLRQAQARGRS